MELILLLLTTLLLASCAPSLKDAADGEMKAEPASEEVRDLEKDLVEPLETPEYVKEREVLAYDVQKALIIDQFEGASPTEWGENVTGVLTEFETDEKIIALTFDACIGQPDSFDEELINFLIAEEVPATLFMGGSWIQANEEEFLALAENPLFEIANHGFEHKPLSVSGELAYGISGTQNIAEAFDEIYQNQLLIEELTGVWPQYFRSGTAYYDEVAVKIASELELKTVNYNQLGDAGATFSESEILASLDKATPGSIYLFHMNHPQSEIAAGVKAGISHLKSLGFQFVQLGEVDESLK